MTEEDFKKIDEYLEYLKSHPEEVERINNEVEHLWNYLKEYERTQRNTYNPNWDRPFTI